MVCLLLSLLLSMLGTSLVVVHDDDDGLADGDIPPTAFRHNDPTRIA